MLELQPRRQLLGRLRHDLAPERHLACRHDFLVSALAHVVLRAPGDPCVARQASPVVADQLEPVECEAERCVVARRRPGDHVGRDGRIGAHRRLVVATVAVVAAGDAQALRRRRGQLDGGVEGVDLAVQGLRRKGRHARREDRVLGRREEGVVLCHPAVGQLAGQSHRRRDVVARRSPELLELVVRGQRELPGRCARHHRKERVGPGEPGVIVAERREHVAQRRLQSLGRIRCRELGAVGLLVHRRANCDAVEKNEPAAGRVPSRSSWRRLRRVLQPSPPMRVPPRSRRLYLKPMSIGCSVLASGMLAVAGSRKARRKRQHVAAAAEERSPRALGQMARYFGIADVQGIEAFAAGLARELPTVEPQVGCRQVGVVAVVAASADGAVEDRERAFAIEPGVVTELLRRVGHVADADVDAARRPLGIWARRAFPLRRVDLRRSAGGGAQHAECG